MRGSLCAVFAKNLLTLRQGLRSMGRASFQLGCTLVTSNSPEGAKATQEFWQQNKQ